MPQLSKFEIHLHWIAAVGMIALLIVGTYMHENEVYSLYPIHKSVGTFLFAIFMIRVVLRLKMGWPETVSTGKKWEHQLSRFVHWALLISTVVLPV